jgi:alpha-L-rhamnosidase
MLGNFAWFKDLENSLFFFSLRPVMNQIARFLASLLLMPLAMFADTLEDVFTNPPPAARPGVMWMWMGCNNSKAAITRDLEALHAAGYGRTLMFSLADVTTPWAHPIGKSPTPEIVAWTEPWWALVRHAALESKRLGMEFGMFNGPGYETSGGSWITPELTMQEVCFSQQAVTGGSRVKVVLDRPKVDPHAVQLFPVYNPATGVVDKPEIPARKTYFKDIAVLAMPADGLVAKDRIIDLSKQLGADGKLEWDAPAGQWVIYRFGHTTMGTLMQPSQWAANGFECDKMSAEAVGFHMKHVIGEIKKHVGDLVGTGFHSVHVDSYEAGMPSWTPKMREEFAARRGYELRPFLATFAKRTVGSEEESGKFRSDFEATIKDLYRDAHFAVTSRLLREAGLVFSCEPYGGPWRQEEIMPMVPTVMTEFWTYGGNFSGVETDATVAALRKSGQNIVEAEAFTGDPADSQWSETPAWLKPMGDTAFCAGVNRFILHRYTPQPWDDRYQPGNTMGRWGTHFDRTQTWWEPGKAMVRYWTRCQALLQWGAASQANGDFTAAASAGVKVQSMHRKSADADVFFVANTARTGGEAWCSFQVTGRQPEWWDAVTGTMRDLPQFEEQDGRTLIPLTFAPTQSGFVVFRKTRGEKLAGGNFPALKQVAELRGAWDVTFDPKWGGPTASVKFDTLTDWTQHATPGIKYFSGKAIYRQTFNAPAATDALQLSLGSVNCIARIRLNGRGLGVAWCPPWSVAVPPGLLRPSGNVLEIEVTNTWANRLIGDEQEPPDCEWLPGHMAGGNFLKEFPDWFLKKQPRPSKGRFCFTTWNYFTKDSPLLPSGLLGPVRLLAEDTSLPLALTVTKPGSAVSALSAAIVVTTSGDLAEFDAPLPQDNILAKATLADTGAGTDSGTTTAEPLRNGTTLNGSGGHATLNDGKTYRAYAEGATFTAKLDLTHAPNGYDLASLVTYARHPDGRASQNYEVFVARAAAPEKFEPLAPAKFETRGEVSKVQITGKAAAPLAAGIGAVRLVFHDGPAGANIYREIILTGTPSSLPSSKSPPK